ncbi:MAG: DNA polymerase III subunit delta [Clostridia bacterium]|nr:DNA polymerase III subunit delta [Clostridia bacterium]
MSILDEHIKNNSVKGIYLLFGDEKYDIERYIEKIKKAFSNLELGINFFVLDKTNIDTLSDAIESVSFFGLEKLIVVKNTGLKFNKELLENISNPELAIVFVEDNVDKRTAEYKYLSKNAVCQECTKLNAKDAAFYIVRTLNSYKIKVKDNVAEYMVSVCTEDKQTLINEFKKIVAYLEPGSDLTKEVIDEICTRTLDAKIFDLMDLVMNKKKKEALKVLEDMLAQKTYIGMISGMMYKQIKQMYGIKLLEEKIRKEGLNVNIATELGIHPFSFSKLKAASANYAIKELEELLLEFDEYDSFSKTGRMDSELGIKRLILSM